MHSAPYGETFAKKSRKKKEMWCSLCEASIESIEILLLDQSKKVKGRICVMGT